MDDQHRSPGQDGPGAPDGPGGSPWSRPTGPPPAGSGPADPEEHPTEVIGWPPQGRGSAYGYAESDAYAQYGGPDSPAYATAPMRPAAFGSPAYAEPGFPAEPEPQRRGRRVGRLGAVVAGVCLLVIGLGGGYLVAVAMGFGDTDAGASSAGRSAQNVSAQDEGPRQPPATGGSGDGPAPGPAAGSPLGSLGAGAQGPSGTDTGNNAALGVVASIDGDDFVVRTLDGGEDDVSTDGGTYIVTVRGVGGISKLAVGDLVFVGGKGRSDGSIEADMVLGGAFPELGAGTR